MDSNKKHANTQIFIVSKEHGFLPIKDPLATLPKKYDVIERLLNDMVVNKPDGSKGLMWYGLLGETIMEQLPLIEMNDVSDLELANALFRDYSILAAAYLQEPCDHSWRKYEEYGMGRPVLIKNIAVPLVQLAKKLDCKPYMDYSQYVLNNWQRIVPQDEMALDNIKAIRTFSGNKDENNYIIVHAALNSFTGSFVSHVQ